MNWFLMNLQAYNIRQKKCTCDLYYTSDETIVNNPFKGLFFFFYTKILTL